VSIAIITGVAGGYDLPVEQPELDGVDFIFFTDGNIIPEKGTGWTYVHGIDAPSKLDSRRKAKFPKCNPQRYDLLRTYDAVIWIDGTLTVLKEEFPQELLSHMKNGVVLSPHFENRDNYSEATIDTHPKYHNEPLANQAAHYRQEGMPSGTQLYECTILAWDPNHAEAQKISEMWLQENLTWSYQDQVSLPYVIWKTGIEPGLLPQSWRKYEWVNMGLHDKDEQYV